jgi:hypothetical protein
MHMCYFRNQNYPLTPYPNGSKNQARFSSIIANTIKK